MIQIQFLASGLDEITMQSDKCYKTFEKGLKEGPHSMFYFRKMNQEPEKYREPKSQRQRGFEEMCRETLGLLNSQSTLFSFCFLLEFRLKSLISQVWARETCCIFRNNVGGKKAQNRNASSLSFESQDTAAQL